MNEMKNDLPLVSVISINYNNSGLTIEMLQSLDKVTYPNLEIIVVDNGSPTDNPDIIKEKYPNIKFIKSAKNLGFAGGNNLGIKEATGKHVLFLNNDTEVEPDFLEPMVELLESDPSIGLVTPKIKYFFSENKNTIQYAGSIGINLSTGRGEKIGSFEPDTGQYNHIKETALGHGAAMLIPYKVIMEVGLMPDLFFLYYEEHDWTEMIKRAGYKVYYHGLSTIYHKESMSVGKNTPLRTYYMTRGRLIFIRRNARGIQKFFALLFFSLLSVPKNSLSFLLKKEFALFKAFWQGFLWHWNQGNLSINPRLETTNDGKKIIRNAYQHQIKIF